MGSRFAQVRWAVKWLLTVRSASTGVAWLARVGAPRETVGGPPPRSHHWRGRWRSGGRVLPATRPWRRRGDRSLDDDGDRIGSVGPTKSSRVSRRYQDCPDTGVVGLWQPRPN